MTCSAVSLIRTPLIHVLVVSLAKRHNAGVEPPGRTRPGIQVSQMKDWLLLVGSDEFLDPAMIVEALLPLRHKVLRAQNIHCNFAKVFVVHISFVLHPNFLSDTHRRYVLRIDDGDNAWELVFLETEADGFKSSLSRETSTPIMPVNQISDFKLLRAFNLLIQQPATPD